MLRIALIMALGLSGCAVHNVAETNSEQAPADSQIVLPGSADHAVVMASRERETGFSGSFEFVVRSTGQAASEWYLNSKLDYRDPMSLNVRIPAKVTAALIAQGIELAALNGQKVRVTGTAKQVRIDFIGAGQATGKYYFQTHLVIEALEQLDLSAKT